ncbi:MAG: radical SAM protein [Clostridia bacterium]|nr:radical SAM protein [Clostridia bacterium]
MEKRRFLKVYIEITNMCNLNCSFCSKTTRADRFMQVGEFEKVVKEVIGYTNLIALHVKGEPFLHPNLKEILDIAEKYNLKVNITTNATLLSKKIEVILNSKSIRQINISLHSAEQNNVDEEKYLENVFEGVDKIQQNTNIIISYRLWNLDKIENNDINKNVLIKLGEKYGIQNIFKKAKKNDFIELDKNIFLNQDIEFVWPDINGDVIAKTGKCYGLRNQIAILSNGDVVPCCLDADSNICLGNIFTTTLKDIIESDRAKAIISGFEKKELVEDLCQRCGFIKTKFLK